MTEAEYDFLAELKKVVARYGNHGPKPDQYLLAEVFVKDAGLFYGDPSHRTAKDNPVVHVVVQLKGMWEHVTVADMFLAVEAMRYYLRKRAEVDKRRAEEEQRLLNSHDV